MRAYSKDKKLISSRRAHIAECASKVFIKKGYDTVNIPDIAKACNMSVGSIYRYVGSKEDILYLIINHGIHKERTSIRNTFQDAKSLHSVEAIKLAMRELIKSVDEIQDIVMLSYRTMYLIHPSARKDVLNIEKAIVTVFEKLLISGCNKGVFEIDNIHMVAQTIYVISHIWAIRRSAFRKLCTLDEYIDFNTKYILKMICKEPYKPA